MCIYSIIYICIIVYHEVLIYNMGAIQVNFQNLGYDMVSKKLYTCKIFIQKKY